MYLCILVRSIYANISRHVVYQFVLNLIMITYHIHCYFQGVILTPKNGVTKKRYRITPFLELKVTPLVVLKCNTTFGAILTPLYRVKI